MDNIPEQFFKRQDESPDEAFYQVPRFTTHIDDETILALTRYYEEVLDPQDQILDLMSSWISHLPNKTFAHISGLGMNDQELAKNPRLNDWRVQNLNEDPTLPWNNDSYDAVIIAVSVQYLTRPFEVFDEIARVLNPGGTVHVAMSHRLFPTKAIYAFQALPPNDRCRLVASYMHQTDVLVNIEVIDRSPPNADPLWVVSGTHRQETG